MMRRLLLALAGATLAGCAHAQAVSTLPSATSVNRTDYVPCSQGATSPKTRKCPVGGVLGAMMKTDVTTALGGAPVLTINNVAPDSSGNAIVTGNGTTVNPAFTGAMKITTPNDDLTYKDTMTPQAIAASGGGNAVVFCPQLSCITTGGTGHQRTSLLVSSPSQYDAEFEEQTLGVTTTMGTGYAPAWAANTSYAQGANVIADGISHAYRALSACTSGSGSGPTGTGSSITGDGNCTWKWINDGAIVAKVGFYNEAKAIGGGGNAWAQANNMQFGASWQGAFGLGFENDVSNNGADMPPYGPRSIYNAWFNSNSAHPITFGLVISGNNHWGIWEQGAIDIGLHLTDSAPISEQIDGTHSSASLTINTVAPAAIHFTGQDSSIFDSTSDTATNGWFMRDGSTICFAGQVWCVKHSTTSGRLEFYSASSIIMSVDSSGKVRASGGFSQEAP